MESQIPYVYKARSGAVRDVAPEMEMVRIVHKHALYMYILHMYSVQYACLHTIAPWYA